MSIKETKMLYILLASFFLTFLVKGVPVLVNYYESGVNNIALLSDKKERLDKLLAKEDFWKKEYSKIQPAEEKKYVQLFSGKSRELVAAKLQTVLKDIARKSGIKIESTLLPEFKQNTQWLIISQNISINGNTKNIVEFITEIEKYTKKLTISKIKLRSNRRQIRGSLTVVGFSRKQIKTDVL